MMKAGLGILSLYQERLLSESDFILIAQFLSKLPDDINGHLLFEKIEVGCQQSVYSIYNKTVTIYHSIIG